MTKQLSISNTTSIAGVSVTAFTSCNSYNTRSKQAISALISQNGSPAIKTTSASNTSALVSIRTATTTSIANVFAEASSTSSSTNLSKANTLISSVANTLTSTSTSEAVSILTSTTAPASSNDILSITKRKYSLSNEQLTAAITHIFKPKMVNIADRSCSSSSSNDTNGRSAALERAYVHDVYENCEESSSGLLKPKVVQFLNNLEPGSIICDVGCGSGRYLNQCNSFVCSIGVDRCLRLSHTAKQNGGEVALCDNLELPFRNECFDAVLSLAVIHHFATTERRVNALRELARILRIGGKVIITVWALEQKHRRFESQDVLIPWQPPKSTNFNNSDDEDYDDLLPPYHAYTEDSNSSRSAGDGDSSSLSSSSPGESCYSFVRRAIKKLASSSKHTWFLDSWILKDTPKNSSLDIQDAKDLPIELRGLENLDYFKDPKLTANLKSRSLSSILYPPTSSCEVVRSISSVPSLDTSALQFDKSNNIQDTESAFNLRTFVTNPFSTIAIASSNNTVNTATYTTNSISSACSRRPKLVKQKQSLYDEDFKLPDTPLKMFNDSSNSNDVSNNNHKNSEVIISPKYPAVRDGTQIRLIIKQNSLNEELMAGNRIQEKERVRKRIQKQRSLNEAFLCKSTILSKKLHVIREGFTKKMKNSTDTLERATKNSLTKLMQNLKSSPEENILIEEAEKTKPQKINITKCTHVHHHHSTFHHHQQQQLQQSQSKSFQQHFTFVSNFQNHLQHFLHLQNSNNGSIVNKFSGPVTICKSLDCASTACYCAVYHHGCIQCNAEHCEEKARRHSRESGSDSSKDNSLQSDTSIESEESFASVIYTPKPGQSQQQEILQHQQEQQQQQQHQSSNSSNSSSSNGGVAHVHANCARGQCATSTALEQCCKIDCKCSVPTSPFLISCPQTPACSSGIAQMTPASPPKTMSAVTAAMDKVGPANSKINIENEIENEIENSKEKEKLQGQRSVDLKDIGFKEDAKEMIDKNAKFLPIPSKITRQTIRDLPPIPKFRKQLGTHLNRQSFPIVRRSSSTTGIAIPAIPKLLSLELFNPETDDLDSDSSEASSPDSIDSVISAPKSNTVSTYPGEKDDKYDDKCTEDKNEVADDKYNEQFFENFKSKSLTTDSNFNVQIHTSTNQLHSQNELSKNFHLTTTNDMQINNSSKTADKFAKAHQVVAENTRQLCCNAKDILLFNAIKRKMSAMNRSEIDNIKDYIDDPYFNYRNRYAQKDLTAIRDELRERRLMLANLSTQSTDNQSPISSSTSSLSSQTRSFTIHEEEEEEDDDKTETNSALKLCDKLKMAEYKSFGNNHKYFHNPNSEIMCLLQDDDASSRDENDIEHDVILEEDEDIENESLLNKCDNNAVQSFDNNTNDQNKFINQDLISEHQMAKVNLLDSKGNSTSSTASLDSPSEHGGNATHHRFYHVFREGELDALINHHVNNLHIVSSYYERANWCIVAEKVHVWTI